MSASSAKNISRPAFTAGRVLSCAAVQAEVFLLRLALADAARPQPGQFYMLRARPSGVFLGRPISVYRAIAPTQPPGDDYTLELEFLILRRGAGTAELCATAAGSVLELVGPLGNTFPRPAPPAAESTEAAAAPARIALVGGGIGIAPIAGFASTLAPGSYDLYAGFRSGAYGLDHVEPARLVLASDDGSCGVRGRLPDVLDAARLRGAYDVVHACGPESMLAWVQHICAEAGVPCWLSLEAPMACGAGACLGCTITTRDGNRRCCSDGPVFAGDSVVFDQAPLPAEPARPRAAQEEPDLSTTIAGVRFANPFIAASGTFGYGSEYAPLVEVGRIGGICSKGLTLEPRGGNAGPRLVETPSGIINSIGLENPGIPHFIEHELAAMLQLGPVCIANLSGSSLESYVEGARRLDASAVAMIELNISCPNVRQGGMSFGLDCRSASQVTHAVRAATSKPLMVKLSPNAPDVTAVAHAVRLAGADAVSLVNTFQAISIDVESGRPLFRNVRAGLSGPAIRPLALRMVYDLALSMAALPPAERIPIIGLGGIASWRDAVEFIMAGATAVQVGTATFNNPRALTDCIDGLQAFMQRKGYRTLEDVRGLAL